MLGLSRVMPPMNFKWEILFGRTIPLRAPKTRAEKNPGITGGTHFSLWNFLFYNNQLRNNQLRTLLPIYQNNSIKLRAPKGRAIFFFKTKELRRLLKFSLEGLPPPPLKITFWDLNGFASISKMTFFDEEKNRKTGKNRKSIIPDVMWGNELTKTNNIKVSAMRR